MESPSMESPSILFGSGELKANKGRIILFSFLAIMLGLASISQTSFSVKFLSWIPVPNWLTRNTINRHIQGSKELRKLTRKDCKEPCKAIEKIVIHKSFSKKDTDAIDKAIKVLANNHEIKQIFNSFGVLNIEETDVLIVPKAEFSANLVDNVTQYKNVGITECGWDTNQDALDHSNDGFTVREKPGGKPCSLKNSQTTHNTIDGTPRIFLSNAIMSSQEELQLTLLHELFHANDIFGYKYPWNQIQVDLMHLPEYRNAVWDLGVNYLYIWSCGVELFFWATTLVCVFAPFGFLNQLGYFSTIKLWFMPANKLNKTKDNITDKNNCEQREENGIENTKPD